MISTTITKMFNNRDDLNAFLDQELSGSINYNIYMSVQTNKSVPKLLPPWNISKDTIPNLSAYNLYDIVVSTTLSYQNSDPEFKRTMYPNVIHGQILDTLVLTQGFTQVVDYLRYKIAILMDYEDVKNIIYEDITRLFQRTPLQKYTEYISNLRQTEAPKVAEVPEAPKVAEVSVKEYMAHSDFHLRTFGYHIGISDALAEKTLTEAIAHHGKEKVLLKLKFLIRIYKFKETPAHKALCRDIQFVESK